jgi:hypothetical protein
MKLNLGAFFACAALACSPATSGVVVSQPVAAGTPEQFGRHDTTSTQRAYFEDQSHDHEPVVTPGAPKLSSTEQELVRIDNVLALYSEVTDPALQKEVRAWLVSQGAPLRRAQTSQDSDAGTKQRANELTPRWIRWLNQQFAELGPKERQQIGELMFEYSDSARSFRAGFDALGFAGPTLAAWAQRNRTPDQAESSDRTEALIVCAYTYDKHYESLYRPRYCNGGLYTDALSSPSRAKELAARLVQNKSDSLTQTALLHVMNQLGVPAMLELFAALETDEQAARASLLGLALYSGWGAKARSRSPDEVTLDPRPIFDRIPVWWTSYPSRRPQALYLLTQLAHNYEGVIAWSKLPSYLGSRISAQEFSVFLDQSPNAVSFMANLADALSDGWRRSAVLIPKLDSWLTNYSRHEGDGPEPYFMVESVVELLCSAGTKSDLVDLQKFLKQRLDSFPSERSTLGSFAEKPLSELCPKLGNEKAGKRPVLFGD